MSGSPIPVFDTIIQPSQLQAISANPSLCLVDCRFSLADTDAGERMYREGHIPGAVYAHLGRDLSNPATTDHGRHPLPPADVLNRRFSAMGIGADTQVVAYDAAGAMIAPRLWWLLKYMGHTRVAVLDGGIKAWEDVGFPVQAGEQGGAAKTASIFAGTPHTEMFVQADALPGVGCLLDSRAEERYNGDSEHLDPVAGHIPGAWNFPYGERLSENGTFLPPDRLRTQFETLLGDAKPEEAVFYCGSGVTACVNLLAMAIAGLPMAKLYAGSWSDWCSVPGRPVATGREP